MKLSQTIDALLRLVLTTGDDEDSSFGREEPFPGSPRDETGTRQRVLTHVGSSSGVSDAVGREEPSAPGAADDAEASSSAQPVATAVEVDADAGDTNGGEAFKARASDAQPFEDPIDLPEEEPRDESPESAELDLADLEAAASGAELLNLGFHLGSAVQRIAAASGQGTRGIRALREAVFLIERYIALLERETTDVDLEPPAARLATDDAVADLQAAVRAAVADEAREGEATSESGQQL